MPGTIVRPKTLKRNTGFLFIKTTTIDLALNTNIIASIVNLLYSDDYLEVSSSDVIPYLALVSYPPL